MTDEITAPVPIETDEPIEQITVCTDENEWSLTDPIERRESAVFADQIVFRSVECTEVDDE